MYCLQACFSPDILQAGTMKGLIGKQNCVVLTELDAKADEENW